MVYVDYQKSKILLENFEYFSTIVYFRGVLAKRDFAVVKHKKSIVMAPKDLKNSEELKLPQSNDLHENDILQQEEAEPVPGGTQEEVLSQESIEKEEMAEKVSFVEEVQSDPEPETVEEPEILPEPEPDTEPEPEIVPEPEVLPEAEPEFQPVPDQELTMGEGVAGPEMVEVTETVAGDDGEMAAGTEAETAQAVVVDEVPADSGDANDVPVQSEPVPVADAEVEEPVDKEIFLVKEEDASDNAPEIEEVSVHDGIADETLLMVEELIPGEEFEEGQPPLDYLSLSQIELVNLLREVVESEDTRHNVDAIVSVFYRKSREKNEELKKKFMDAGGKEEEFIAEEDPYNHDVKELLKKYKQQRFEQVKKLDAEKEINLQKKYEIIEEIKNLLNKEESINRTFQEFRELQKKWYEVGQVPQAKMKDLWDTYHFHVENFYDYIKINKELRDLDLKKNLELKIGICDKTEELLMEPSVIKAFNALQKYHEEWREIGPVPSDKKDEIWERFKAATAKINQKHQDYFEKRKLDQKKNLDAKIALCEKAEEISESNFDSHKEWDEKSRELVELQKVWKTIGFAPKKENNKIYDRFRAACDKFFVNKREYYSKNKDIQQVNLQMKIDLCLEAETLKESTDWKKTTQQFIDIQKRWKEVGPIPRKSSEAIWKRFRAACDYFFEKKAAHFSDIDGEQFENLKLKEQLIEEVENFKADEDAAVALKNLRDLQRRWTEIGHVPLKNKDNIQHRFREAINKQFDALKVDNNNRNVFNFRNKIESMTDNARGLSKVRSEREKYMLKLKQLETDLTLLDNNIGFFANSKNAQALIADVNQKIQDTREKIEQLKEKIRIIDDLDKSEY